MGCKRVFLKERENVMFFNKIDFVTLLPCCILCSLPVSQAVLKHWPYLF